MEGCSREGDVGEPKDVRSSRSVDTTKMPEAAYSRQGRVTHAPVGEWKCACIGKNRVGNRAEASRGECESTDDAEEDVGSKGDRTETRRRRATTSAVKPAP